MIVRPTTAADAGALAAIYGHHVLHGFGTFEEVPPPPEEMARRLAAVEALGLPHRVFQGDDGRILGFAYASAFRPRAAYRYTAEDSVYVSPEALGQGVGRALLADVIAACEAIGLRRLVAVIGDSGNAASIGLHAALGFEPAGAGQAFGYKHGRWVDVVWMARDLNGGASTAPDAPGLTLSGG